MSSISGDFIMSTELECLTSILHAEHSPELALRRFFEIMTTLAPALPAESGIFNAYGRIYTDCGHLELAAAECACPYTLPEIVERQQRLVQKAVQELKEEGYRLLLANNNHSGLLQSGCAIWGSHENYMTEWHPTRFGSMILPFLVTRIYAGAGGIEHPTGSFLAAVRPVRMEQATGGGTTEARAIHSTSREEHHMGPKPERFRYHLILGDGHRSHYNLALQFGATALALKAIFFDDQLPAQVRRIARRLRRTPWVATLRRLNVLAGPDQQLAIDPIVVETQRIYLDGARRYADRLPEPPGWIAGVLRDWQQTLDAMQRLDLGWLSQRLDAFTKYQFYTAVLGEQGKSWRHLPGDAALFHELALLDHSYHEFCNPGSVFTRLDQAGLLDHRVSEFVQPGEETDPFIPQTGTRADARARFIRDHAGRSRCFVDWSWVQDTVSNRRRWICDPFAQRFDAEVEIRPRARRA